VRRVCPHSGLRVAGRCYWCCKQAALNGHRDRLEPEALMFVGFVDEQHEDPNPGGWSSNTSRSHVDTKLEELSRLMDIAPGYLSLLRRILEDDGDKS
jgi:hypothetical protein